MRKPIKILILIFAFSLPDEIATAQDIIRYSGPIIDMHLHAYTKEDFYGPAANPVTGDSSVTSAAEHMDRCITFIKKNKIVLAVVDGESLQAPDQWEQKLGDDFVIKGIRNENIPIDTFRTWASEGKMELFGEIGATYNGYSPSNSVLIPYYEICEKFNIPVAIHTGGSFPGITLRNKNFRLKLGDPLLVEDVLVNYPDLKVYLMHAGTHFYNRTLIMMVQYPNLYVDIAVLNWVPDANKFLIPFLKMAKEHEVIDRVMYGTDQMIWPEAIELAVDNIQKLDFLTYEEKKGIFYNNAARFLALSEEDIARHHNMVSEIRE